MFSDLQGIQFRLAAAKEGRAGETVMLEVVNPINCSALRLASEDTCISRAEDDGEKRRSEVRPLISDDLRPLISHRPHPRSRAIPLLCAAVAWYKPTHIKVLLKLDLVLPNRSL